MGESQLMAYPGCELLGDFFLARAASDGGLIALSWRGDSADDALDLTYAQLESLALTLAADLVDLEQVVIPICLPKSIEMIVAMLAVVLAGKAYCNMEPDLPPDRRRALVEEAAAVDFSSNARRPTVIGSVEGDFLCIDPFAKLKDGLDALRGGKDLKTSLKRDGLPRPPSSAPAYTVYTSGSTGKPKGIIISHSNVAAFLQNYRGVFGRCKADEPRGCRVLQFPSYGFDVSVMNIWDTLAHGGTICMTTKDQLRSDLAQVVRDLRCTHVDLTPTVNQLLIDAFDDPPSDLKDLPAWREKTGCQIWHLSTGSEPVPRWLTQEWLKRGAVVVNDYGPSEATCGVTSLRITPEDSEWLEAQESSYLPIGTANGSTEIYLMSPDSLELVAEGEEGEICIGGPQVSLRGYVNHDLNGGVFVEHAEFGRIYRTGDLGRWLPQGKRERMLECIGRKDLQIKINGLRIEVGEIEQHLTSAQHPELAAAAVDKVEQASGAASLVAFLVLANAERKDGEVAIAQDLQNSDSFSQLTTKLVEALGEKLPTYMLPQTWLPLNRMPVQASGKTDRKQLRQLAASVKPAPRQQKEASKADVEVDEAVLADMRQAWAAILRCSPDELSSSARWAEQGGDSIGFIRLVSRLRKAGYKGASFSTLSGATTLAEGAALLGDKVTSNGVHDNYKPFSMLKMSHGELLKELDGAEGEKSISGDNLEDAWPITPTQEALHVPSLERADSYYAQAVYTVDTRIVSADRFVKAIEELVKLHPMLRSSFAMLSKSGSIVQLVSKQFGVDELCPVQRLKAGQTFDGAIDTFRREDLERMHAFRKPIAFRLLLDDDGQARLCWSMHHALSDGWTLDLYHDDLAAICAGRKPASRPSFAAIAQYWSSRRDKPTKYWSEYLRDASTPAWPKIPDGIWPVTRCTRERRWKGDLAASLKHVSITPAIASRVAIYLALLKQSELGDLAVGIVRSGRDIDVDGAESIVGPCVSTLPSRSGLARSTKTVLDLLRAETDTDGEHRRQQSITIAELASCASSIPPGQRLFTTLITYQSAAERNDQEELPISEPPDSIVMPSVYALSIEVTPFNGGLDLHAYFDERCLPEKEVESLLQHLHSALDFVVKDVEAPISSFLPAVADAPGVPKTNGVSHSKQQNGLDAPKELIDKVAAAWAKVLCIEQEDVDVDARFDRLGGTSILAMRLSALLRRQELSIPASQLATLPTVRSQAAFLAH